MWHQLLQDLLHGNTRALARAISLVENSHKGYEAFLQALPGNEAARVVGITGPPGAGKSTLVDALIGELVAAGKKVGVLCVDPSSPFNLGAVLGDRIRMSTWYTTPNVFIRSLATRGSMGGLHPRIIEITDVLKAAGFEYILVETVGVGQSEIEIAGLADTTVVVVVPEAGDEVQTMKAGLMEIADVFVVNKSDRPDADAFVRALRGMLAPAFHSRQEEIAVLKTVASTGQGVPELSAVLQRYERDHRTSGRKAWLLAERAYHLLQQKRMQDVSKATLQKEISEGLLTKSFNLYQYLQNRF